MESIKNNKFVRILILVLLRVPYVAFWYQISLAISVAHSEGWISVLGDAFGEWIIWVGVILAILIFTSIVYMRCFIKKEWLVHVIAYSATVLWCVMLLIFTNIGNSQFKEFSKEKWRDFPAQRITMYFDLVEKYDVEGYTASKIEDLLGKPDEIDREYDTYVYDDRHGNAVYVKFENDRVFDVYYVD